MKRNKIYCGDALDLINDLEESPKLIIMSPPDLAETSFDLEEYRVFIDKIYKACYDKLDEHGVLASITTDRKMGGRIYTKHIDIINAIGEPFNYKIWAKSLKTNLYILNYCHMLFFRKSSKITNNKLSEFSPDVWLLELDKVKGYKNKDSFPTELVKRIVVNFTNSGDLVLDPFIGTGKTAVIAKSNNRDYIGFELDRGICDLADKRILSELSINCNFA